MADNQSLSFEQPDLVWKSMYTGIAVTVALCGALRYFGQSGWAIGFGAGAGLSLLSLFSLGVLVPILTMPQAPKASQFLLALLLFLKLPIYAVVLYAVTRMHGVDARSAFPGVLLAPMVIGIRTSVFVARVMFSQAVHKREIRRGGRVTAGHAPRNRVSLSSLKSESVREQG